MSTPPTVGMLTVDKPGGRTSHDVVVQLRKRLGARAGHTGTLDPQATGVLLVCLGKATRLTRFLQHCDKVYDCVVRMGWATDSYDADGEPLADPVPAPAIGEVEVAPLLERFLGDIEQVPPVFSAKKVRGQPSYRRVRRGETVEHQPVRVTIHTIDLQRVDGADIHLRVHCGAGTYVRALAHDLGAALGCPSHLAALRRLRVHRFGLERAISWEEVCEAPVEALLERLIPPADMLPEWPAAVINEAGLAVLANGGVIEPRHVAERCAGSSGQAITGIGEGHWARVLDTDGTMLAAAEIRPGGILQPRVVLRSGQ